MNFEDWTFSESYPLDGEYLCRMDEDDEEPMVINVNNGQAFDNGKRRIIYGYEWKVRK